MEKNVYVCVVGNDIATRTTQSVTQMFLVFGMNICCICDLCMIEIEPCISVVI